MPESRNDQPQFIVKVYAYHLTAAIVEEGSASFAVLTS